jgi:dolichyldiphosphatase
MTSKESASISSALENGLSFIGSSTSAIVSLGFFAALAYYRDALMVTFFLGAIGNAILGKILKRLLNQDRPTSDAPQPSDKGMPSSHAMSLGFIGTFTSLLLPPFGIPIACYVLISLYYRVRIKLHTTDQVLVGLGVGGRNQNCCKPAFRVFRRCT